MNQIIRKLTVKELTCHFAHSMAIIFIFSYLAFSFYWVMYPGEFFKRNLADYAVLLEVQPYLLLFLVPSLTMNLWALERQTSTIELMFTLPITQLQLVVAKFLSVLTIAFIAIAGTLPFWGLLNYLGEPDNAAIATGYLGLILLCALYTAIGQFYAILSRSPLGGFVMTMLTLAALLFIGEPAINGILKSYLSEHMVDTLQGFSILNHYQVFIDGYFSVFNAFYFVFSVVIWLWLSNLLAQYKQVKG